MVWIIFSISFGVMAFMVGMKMVETKFGRDTFFYYILSKGDDHALKLKNSLSLSCLNIKNKLIFFFSHGVPDKLHSFLVKLKAIIDEKYAKLLMFLHGKRTINRRNSVSFFLKNVSEYKKSIDKVPKDLNF